MTNEVKRALVNASTETSSYNADQLIINRHDENYLLDNINSVDDIQMVKDAMNSSIERLNTRVLDAVSTFKGYTHVMVIGGGAALSADAIRKKIAIQPERFYVAEEPQFALVRGLKLLG